MFQQTDCSNSITSESSRKWLRENTLKTLDYLRDFHKEEDWKTVSSLLYHSFPDEGKKLIENYDMSEQEKYELFLDYIYFSPQLTLLLFADERMGKDATLCKIFEDTIKRCTLLNRPKPRIVTLMNIKNPPFVDDKDMFFSFQAIPSGTAQEEIWVYCSELEVVLPARDGQGAENRLFATISGTFAQNHIKIFGCVKLASKVDLNAIRGCNAKAFKYINPEKLQIEGVERVNVLSPLGSWLLPKDRNEKTQTLFAFDSQLFTVHLDLPSFWTQDYSEQFNNIPESKIWEAIDSVCLEMKPVAVLTFINQKFRNKNITLKDIQKHFLDLGINFSGSSKLSD